MSDEARGAARAAGLSTGGIWARRLVRVRTVVRALFGASAVERWLGLSLLVALVGVRVWDPVPVESLRLKTFDLYQFLNPREPTGLPVAVVDIDEESLSEVGQWPWPRTLIADLVRQIQSHGVIAIGFDILFPEPDRMSPGLMAEALSDLDPEAREELRRLPSNDQLLARALRGSRVVLGQAAYPRALAFQGESLTPAPLATLGADPAPFLAEFPGAVRNIKVLEAAASGLGLLTLLPESDGVVRRAPAFLTVEGAIVPSLILELLRIAAAQDAFLIKTDEAGVRSVTVAGVEVPTDRNGRIWIRYARYSRDRYVSARDVLWGLASPERLAGKLVLIGGSATGLFDVKSTPLDAAMPGVEVHAQLLETILTRSHLVRPNYALGAEVVLTAAVGLVMVLLVPVLGALTGLLLGLGIAAALGAGSWLLFAREGVLIDVAYPLLASFAVYVFLIFSNYIREETARRQVRSAFGQYLSPDLVEQLARDPDQLVLGGQTKEMTVLFSDVRGFAMIAELFRDDPQGLTRLMNRFLTPVTNAIVEHRGTIDKYMGDAVMAFWNAPLDDPDHAGHACEAALAMIAALERLNQAREGEAARAGAPYLPLRIGIGVNTGDCVVGNLGSELRFDYSVLGDPVNLASRLEGQSQTYGVDILVGSNTAERVGDGFALLELDLIRVKGKTVPERVHALLGDGSLARSPAFQELTARTGDMLARYRARDWDGAGAALADCRALDPGLGLHALFDLFAERIAAFRADPPPPDWDGVFEARSK